MDNSNSSKKKYYIGGAVLAVAAALCFYFLYWVKTPAYSLGIIKTSVEKHDLVRFEQHVDLNSLYGRAFDSYIENEFKGNENPLIMGFVKAVRGTVLDELTNKTKKYVESGRFEEEQPAADKNAGKKDPFKVDSTKAVKDLGQRVNARGMEFTGIDSTEKDGKIAVVAIRLHDKQLNKDFIAKLRMRELDNGEWQAVELSNLVDFINEHDKAVKDRLAELNKPIREKMEKAVRLTGNITASTRNTNPFFPMHELSYTIGLQLPDKANQVKELEGTFTIADKEGEPVVTSKTHLSGFDKLYSAPDYSASKEFALTAKRKETLNPFLPKEKAIMDNGVQAYKLGFTVDKLVMADGTVVAVLDKLPEEK